eukprot:5016293-Prymnesium_polylepis.1
MSNIDVSVQLHFALFKGACGFVLKPSEMRVPVISTGALQRDDTYWPPPREELDRTTIELLSLHQLPKACCSRHLERQLHTPPSSSSGMCDQHSAAQSERRVVCPRSGASSAPVTMARVARATSITWTSVVRVGFLTSRIRARRLCRCLSTQLE